MVTVAAGAGAMSVPVEVEGPGAHATRTAATVQAVRGIPNIRTSTRGRGKQRPSDMNGGAPPFQALPEALSRLQGRFSPATKVPMIVRSGLEARNLPYTFCRYGA